ncbi:hypothetical protein [Hoeflea sp.]|uniref:hypothetical protein n=1 Tax=Hoeflea sp. TaxID=1940281 RepID=UPI003B010C9B
MFASIAKAAALTALIAVGANTATPSNAEAGNVSFGVYFGTPGYGPGPYWGPAPRPHRGICKPRSAVNKAWRMGVKNPRISSRNRSRVIVRGWRYGHKTKVVFANRRYCPVIAYR